MAAECLICKNPVSATLLPGEPSLCSRHVKAWRAWRQVQAVEIDEWNFEELSDKLLTLERLGVRANLEWQRLSRGRIAGTYTGRVVVDPDELIRRLQE